MEILIQVTELLTIVAERNGVSIESALADTRALAYLDGGQIRQVLTNIMVNGIQAMVAGGTLSVSLNRSQPEEGMENGCSSFEWELTVRDEGVGIPVENLETIFEPFFTTKDVGDGTGLVCRWLIIWFRSNKDELKSAASRGKAPSFEFFFPFNP